MSDASTSGLVTHATSPAVKRTEFPKVLIVAPHWKNPYHLGVLRVERFIRWFNQIGYKVVLLTAATSDSIRELDWGTEIAIKDPLKVPSKFSSATTGTAKFSRMRRVWRTISSFTFNPDQHIVWGRKIVNHPMVDLHAAGIRAVLSSSPPESCHVSALLLSHKFSTPLIIDMRDGWLDEPLRPIVERFWLRRYLEEKMEKRIIAAASHVFVTSSVWKVSLLRRYQQAAEKTSVLTNGYPFPSDPKEMTRHQSRTTITLLHAGQFSISRVTYRVGGLLRPLLGAIQSLSFSAKGEVVLQGNLGSEDLEELKFWKGPFNDVGWELISLPQIPRGEVLEKLRQADGLLLLSPSSAVIPSKLFEYIPTAKPILAITPRGSAVWELCENIPQIFLLDCSATGSIDSSPAEKFIDASRTGNYEHAIPKDFTDENLSRIFDEAIRQILPTRRNPK